MNQVPCPGRIITELGDGFSIGVVMGSLWYFIKGAYYSVRDERIKGGLVLVRKRAPILGGSFAMWAGLFSISSCCMVYLREKEDPLNSVVGGAVTGFLLSIRGGIRRAIPHGIFGGVFLGVIEVVGVLFTSYQKRQEIIQINHQMNEMKRQMERSRGMMPMMGAMH
jgi:import inner membrane translocase subunit TIM17